MELFAAGALVKGGCTTTVHDFPQGLFQKLSSGGALFFFGPLHPQDKHGESEHPHASALINLPHYGSNVPWPPGRYPPPLRQVVNKTASPWMISGTALIQMEK